MGNVLSEIQPSLKENALLVSLVPKITIAKISTALKGFGRIVRMIPNAPSIINAGFNPVAFSEAVSSTEKAELLAIFATLGACPEVAEEKLEAFAIVTGMGPTYLWFQLYQLHQLGSSFGLSPAELEHGISQMVMGTVKTMYDARLSADAVMNLVPVKPLGDEEENIKKLYTTKLEALYKRLKE